ncbi:DUF2306 domain-containing protein [Luteimonas terrae]|uniref:DUF2306 domain-containing protein n=1 Tax=Luteimonas terrae TaxID=1530191 RepID=A0A4R5UA28_9GAMM|nr:DUF2306 domain-containing protein [Luteimonas terrae]TDK31555.1 DUF2306 domain-containing protein [Luteimonas terrae]
MAVSTVAPPDRRVFKARRLLRPAAWLCALAITAYFLRGVWHDYAVPDSAAYGMYATRRAWLWLHLGAGAAMLLLGPWQFIARLRTAMPRLHRWTGRLYLAAGLFVSLAAAGLVATSPAPAGIRIAFAATGLAWLVTAAFGYIAIRRGQVQMHRRWMLRNYLVTLSPIAFRLALHAPGMAALAPPTLLIPVLLWSSWALPLLLYEIGRLVRGFRDTRAMPAAV